MKKLIIATALLLTFFTGSQLMAQAPPPPPPSHGETGNQNGGNAPIGSGIFILMGLGAIYAGYKTHSNRKKENN